MNDLVGKFNRHFNIFLQWFIPVPLHLPLPIIDLLAKIYPTVNWKRVRFYNTLPWFASFAPSYFDAMTLPATYSFKTINIYLKRLDPFSRYGLSTIVHEGYHILQFQNIFKGAGVSYFRPWVARYIKGSWDNGYFKHVQEIPAYAYEIDFVEEYRKFLNDGNNPSNVTKLVETAPDLIKVMPSGHVKFHWIKTPLCYFLTAVISVVKIVVEFFLLIYFIILWTISKLLKLAGR